MCKIPHILKSWRSIDVMHKNPSYQSYYEGFHVAHDRAVAILH
jgi:hypothetical protein